MEIININCMKYVKSREQYITEQLEIINEYSGSKSTFHNDSSWGDSLVGKLFSAVGKQFKKIVKKGVIGKYLIELDKEFKKGQIQAIQYDEVSQKFRAYQNIIIVWNALHTKDNFDYDSFLILLDTTITDYTSFLASKDISDKYKDIVKEHLTNLKEFRKKINSAVTEALDVNLPKEKIPSTDELSDVDFHKIELRKMRTELKHLESALTNTSGTDKNKPKVLKIKSAIERLKKRITEKEFDIESMEKELSTKKPTDPSTYTVTYKDANGNVVTSDAANPQNPNDNTVNVNTDPKNPNQKTAVNVDDIIDVDKKSNKAADDAKDNKADDELNNLVNSIEDETVTTKKSDKLTQEQLIKLFDAYYPKTTIDTYVEETVISATEAKKLNAVLLKNASSNNKQFINPIAVVKIFNKAEMYGYSINAKNKESGKNGRELDDTLYLQWNQGVLTLLENYKDYIPTNLVEFINKMLSKDNFMNDKAQQELLAKYFNVSFTPDRKFDPSQANESEDTATAKYKYVVKDSIAIDAAFGKVFVITGNTIGYVGDGTSDSNADMVFYMIGMTKNNKYYRFIVSKNDTTYLKAIDKGIPTYAADTKAKNSEYIVLLRLEDLKKQNMNVKKGSTLKFKRIKPATGITTIKNSDNTNALSFNLKKEFQNAQITSDTFTLTLSKILVLVDSNGADFSKTVSTKYNQYNTKMVELSNGK